MDSTQARNLITQTFTEAFKRTRFLRFAQNILNRLDTKDDRQKPIIKLVDHTLAAKRGRPQANVSEWEREIDPLVYQLDELTDAGITIVEATSGRD